jgi:hypothetical protein
MKLNIVDEYDDHICHVEVSPSDTIWTLKGKLHREYLRRASERAEREGEASEEDPSEGEDVIPPPDDQTLVISPNGRELSQGDKAVEFYDLHEGSEVRCVPKWRRFPQEMHFRKCVDVFRKVERNTLSMEGDAVTTSIMTVCVYHACCHMHEVTVLNLQFCAIGDEGVILIAEVLDKNTSLKELCLGGVFPPPSFFIHCCIFYSFIS